MLLYIAVGRLKLPQDVCLSRIWVSSRSSSSKAYHCCLSLSRAICSFLSTLTCGKSRRQFSKTALNSVSSKPRAVTHSPFWLFQILSPISFVWCVNCQNWPIRRYTRSWYTGMRCLRKWLQAPLFSLFFSPPFPPRFRPLALSLVHLSRSLEQAMSWMWFSLHRAMQIGYHTVYNNKGCLCNDICKW